MLEYLVKRHTHAYRANIYAFQKEAYIYVKRDLWYACHVKRDLYVLKYLAKRHTHTYHADTYAFQKETYVNVKRDLEYACQKRPIYFGTSAERHTHTYRAKILTFQKETYIYIERDLEYACRKRHIYIGDKRDLYILKRPINIYTWCDLFKKWSIGMLKETYMYVRRDLYVYMIKRPICMSEETYMYTW